MGTKKAKPNRKSKPESLWIQRGDGKIFRRDTFLREIIAEKVEALLAKVKVKEHTRITQYFTSNPGAKISITMEFDEINIRGTIAVFPPTSEPKPEPKDLYEQAKEFLASTEP